MSDFSMADPAAWARHILDSSSYVVLATADEGGTPWPTPVWFAQRDYREFFWVSSHEARHSRNIASRPEVGLVVFDSSVKPGSGQGVYMRATAAELREPDLTSGLNVYVARSATQTGWKPGLGDVSAPGLMRVYRARATEFSMLAKDGQPDHRVAIDLKR